MNARLAGTALLLTSCAFRPSLPVLGSVPSFSLTDQTGAAFQSASLRGHVWVADFIYTNCPGPCPLMSRRMKRIEEATGPAVRLVSFTVDPARDTPGALSVYARRFRASSDRWAFLTGEPQTLETISKDAFKLGPLDPSFNHSTRFVLVDAQGRVRAYYRMTDTDMVAQIVRDAEALAKERKST